MNKRTLNVSLVCRYKGESYQICASTPSTEKDPESISKVVWGKRDVGLLWSEANDKGKFPDCLRTGGLGRWSVE